MTPPTFLLCVGAQKAGTTWLHRYVGRSAGAVPTLMKEFHVWNKLYPGQGEIPVEFEGSAPERRHALHREMVDDPERYFDYFAERLQGRDGSIASDMTPAYASLPVEAYQRIREGFVSRGIMLRVVFLMRDPIERCWSAVRMYRRKGIPLPGVPVANGDEDAVRQYCRTAHARDHACYESTVANLEAAFPAAELFFGFYETLFTPDSIRAISSFLGIEPRPDFADEHFNVSAKAVPLSIETRRAVADAYAATLSFCGARFPVVRSIWPTCDLERHEGNPAAA